MIRRTTSSRFLKPCDPSALAEEQAKAAGLRPGINPLFYKDNNRMLFGDAKKMLDEVLAALRG